MTKKILLIAVAFVLVPAIAALAGLDYSMKCTNCGYSSHVRIGGGKGFDQITGYCPASKKFVYITWKRKEKKPEPMASVWDPATGKMIDLYKCPDCGKPIIPLQAQASKLDDPGFDYCPKCGKQTFKIDKSGNVGIFD